MASEPAPTLSRHNECLQSMRGLAALIVIVGHAQLIIVIVLQITPISMLLPLHAAVLFFFVLSGYVLGESFRRSGLSWSGAGHYLFKRVMRLFPVFWVAVLLGAAVFILIDRQPIAGVNDWLNGAFSGASAVIPVNVIPALLAQTVSMNGALWSVQVEIFMIPVLPLLVLISNRVPLIVDLAILAALSVLAERQIGGLTSGTPLSFVAYLNCFYIGVMLPKLMRSGARDTLANRNVFGISIAALFGFTFIAARGSFPLFGNSIKVIEALISAELIAFVMLNPTSTTARALSRRPLVWLGDISYSFYAYGTPLLMLTATIILSYAPADWLSHPMFALPLFVFIAVAAVASTALIAWVSYLAIEQPFMRLKLGPSSRTRPTVSAAR